MYSIFFLTLCWTFVCLAVNYLACCMWRFCFIESFLLFSAPWLTIGKIFLLIRYDVTLPCFQIPLQVQIQIIIILFPFDICGSLSMHGPESGTIRRCSLIGIAMALIEEVCHFWSGQWTPPPNHSRHLIRFALVIVAVYSTKTLRQQHMEIYKVFYKFTPRILIAHLIWPVFKRERQEK
jgi:hypothetical protein